MATGELRASRPVDAVQAALARELEKRGSEMKPVEIVKMAIASYLSFVFAQESSNQGAQTVVESADSAELRRGTQAAVDRMLFNANYWRAAYEQDIIAACVRPEDALSCLTAISVWVTHALRLNTLSPDEVVATFERFCPPFKLNNRRGSRDSRRGGKGPLPDFSREILALEKDREGIDGQPESIESLHAILEDMEAEAAVYDELGEAGALNALFTILPAWCLQNRIELVSGSWWDDYDVMNVIIDALHAQFIELGFGEAICRYFLDSCYEALDAYHRDVADEASALGEMKVPELVAAIQGARDATPEFETDGYGGDFPSWLISKEQLIWNILVCSVYGPSCARPLLVDFPDLLAEQSYVGKTDVMTELARISFARYTSDRVASQTDEKFTSFASLPADLRSSSIAYISSIHSKLETLGYEVLPAGSCYPERCVTAFTASEVECLAILEHRRWLRERRQAGWHYAQAKDVEARTSPYMVPWEELPERAKEWNRSAVRSIPALLASVNLAVVK